MASIKLQGDTSGELTLTVPAVAGTNTLTLPTTTGTFVTENASGKVGSGGTPSEPLSVFRTGGQEEGINIRNTSSGNGSRLTFETTRSDDSSVQDMAAIQVYAVAGYDSAASSDAIMTFQTQDSGTTAERMRIDNSGKIAMGTTTPLSAELTVFHLDTLAGIITKMNGTSAVNAMSFQNGNGQIGRIQVNGTTTSYITSSDYRLKENVVPMSGSIDRLKQLNPSTWSWKTDGSHGEGFLAHEAQAVVPEAVGGEHNEVDVDGNPVYQGIDQSKLVPLLTAALQEAIQRIEALEAK